MRLSFTKRFMVIDVIDTKNPDYKNYELVPVGERNKEVVTVFGKSFPMEPGKSYTLDMGLAMEKKTFTESTGDKKERKQYDIAKLYINGIREEE